MKENKKVIVGMSGGVDSAVATLLLKEQGYDVIAVFMKNWEEEENGADSSICSATQDFNDARLVCDQLQIPLQVVNFSREYWDRVFQYMLDEYAQGRTPNPDIVCNQEIKFKEFLNYAKTLDADFIATGHYARHLTCKNGTQVIHKLYKALDHTKDQSYFLYTLGQTQLAFTLFPLGELTKVAVRTIAKKNLLPNCEKKDSTGICFIGERKFKSFLSEYLLAKPGKIVVADSGEELGKHDGLMFYTLGQRQGLGIGGKKNATEAPWYVVKKNIAKNELIVAQNAEHPLLMSDSLSCQKVHWIAERAPLLPLHCAAKIRYRQTEQKCAVIAAVDGIYNVTFAIPQRAITPGQAVVFYAADGECLGGGTIA